MAAVSTPSTLPERAVAALKAAARRLRRFDGENADACGRFHLARWIFLRLLGMVYLSAFLSFGSQVEGLIGSHGILPAARYQQQIEDHYGPERYYLVPTLCWLDCSDAFLDGLCLGGAALAVLLIAGIAPIPILLLLWACYLSLCTVGQIFMGYQWDSLLLETGFLALFLAPGGFWPRLGRQRPPSRIILGLFWWLLFRLVFMSGVVKLLSGDPTWRNGTALEYHYWTQPLPTWTSWYMNQLPGWFQSLSVWVTLVLELVVPLLIFLPRRCRQAAFAGLIGLQILIATTGNYGFFNLLTIALSVLLLDDAVFPARWRARLPKPGSLRPGWTSLVRWMAAPLILLLTAVPFFGNLHLLSYCPRWLVRGYLAVRSFQSFNSYGLFAVMTTKRHEIQIEGSEDGKTWLPYSFKWKPGDVARRPDFAPLHMPRLDWQMWFAALADYRQSPWFGHFLVRLLEGSPPVLQLLEHNPFPDRPPRYIRAVVYDYRFTEPGERRERGAWWRRHELGLFCPILPPRAGSQE
jgi:lipase maturation factor 1